MGPISRPFTTYQAVTEVSTSFEFHSAFYIYAPLLHNLFLPDILSGLIAVSPAGVDDYTPEDFSIVKTPCLIIQGRRDQGRATAASNALIHAPNATRIQMVSKAAHAVYRDNNRDFMTVIHNFMKLIPKEEF